MRKNKQRKKLAKPNKVSSEKGFYQPRTVMLAKPKQHPPIAFYKEITDWAIFLGITDEDLLKEKIEYELHRIKRNEEGMMKLEKILGIPPGDYRGAEASEASILLCERAVALNLYAELKGTFDYPSPFNNARAALFVAVGELILKEGLLTGAVLEKIKAAGQMLWESGGIRDMDDPLVWLFIPEALHQDISLAWNGIGDWKAQY